MSTVEAWAREFVLTTSLSGKLSPAAPPAEFSGIGERLALPGRPAELVQREKRRKTPKDLRDPAKRAEVIHTFLHHELQAAELMAWAILAFPETPLGFRRGLLGICRDELRHLGLYAEHLVTLGHPFGSFEINDWFWKRVPGPDVTPLQFVARLGIAFEGGNLDHGVRFTEKFAEAGDARAAEIQSLITREEEAHAAFGLHWFREFSGGLDFDRWSACLPAPLSPMMARGETINVEARQRAGFPPEFLERLEKVLPLTPALSPLRKERE
ncbi:MAG: DUF455 family protein [Archangium sp.]